MRVWRQFFIVADAVEKLRSRKRRRNKEIDDPTGANHCSAAWPAGESILRLGPLKIVFQRPQRQEVSGKGYHCSPCLSAGFVLSLSHWCAAMNKGNLALSAYKSIEFQLQICRPRAPGDRQTMRNLPLCQVLCPKDWMRRVGILQQCYRRRSRGRVPFGLFVMAFTFPSVSNHFISPHLHHGSVPRPKTCLPGAC
jgi:hypothetical protein